MGFFFDGKFENIFKKHPLVIMDIGAAGGISSKWKVAGKHLKAICFEPDKRTYDNYVFYGS